MFSVLFVALKNYFFQRPVRLKLRPLVSVLVARKQDGDGRKAELEPPKESCKTDRWRHVDDAPFLCTDYGVKSEAAMFLDVLKRVALSKLSLVKPPSFTYHVRKSCT